MPPALPPYLTSGASSRAHHALLVSLNEARSALEEAEILSKEVRRCRDLLMVKGQSTGKISETLLILLHCCVVSPRKLEDIEDWALFAALQLAESGRNLRERRIGYLYLTERLPPGHELSLMLINTIRKDLSSSIPQETLLALHTIVQHPSHDLAPAVTPLLVAKTMLRHKESIIRQRTLQALIALHLSEDDLSRTVGPRTFPLKLPKIIKLLGQETDNSVVTVLVRLIRSLLESRVSKIEDEEERGYLIEQVIAQSKRSEVETQLLLDVLRTCGVLMKGMTNNVASEIVVGWVRGRLKGVQQGERVDGAFLLEACRFIASSPALLHVLHPLISPIIGHIAILLRPSPSSSSPSALLPTPNDHILALRCLTLLPRSSWDGVLRENEMRVIMEGLNSPDPSVRLSTLRLLYRLSPQLLVGALHNQLESLRSLSNLTLPLGLSSGITPEKKLRLGKDETASRALEVVEARAELSDGDTMDATEGGMEFGKDVISIFDAYSRGESGEDVWEDGVRRIMAYLKKATISFRDEFVATIHEEQNGSGSDATLAVLRATVAGEYGHADLGVAKMVAMLLKDVRLHISSVQELVLVASVGLACSSPQETRDACVGLIRNASKDLQSTSSRYIQRRATQVLEILQDDLLAEISEKAKTRALPDILQAIVSVYSAQNARKTPSSSNAPRSSSSSPPASLRSAALAGNSLRYDPYDSPPVPRSSQSKMRASTRSPGASPSPARLLRKGKGVRMGMSAGEYALLDADGYDHEQRDEGRSESEEGMRENLMGLSLDGRSPRNQRDIDPFRSDDTSTPRLR